MGDDGTYDTCGICRHAGELLPCSDGCKEAFHVECVGMTTAEIPLGNVPWYCSACDVDELRHV